MNEMMAKNKTTVRHLQSDDSQQSMAHAPELPFLRFIVFESWEHSPPGWNHWIGEKLKISARVHSTSAVRVLRVLRVLQQHERHDRGAQMPSGRLAVTMDINNQIIDHLISSYC